MRFVDPPWTSLFAPNAGATGPVYLTRISRQICKFSNTWNWTGLEQLETPHNFLDTPNKLIVQSGDVQKAGVLGGVRLDPEQPQDQEIPRVPPAIWKSRLISFIHF